MRLTSPWQVVQALGPRALMCRWCGKWACRATKWTRVHTTGFLSVQASRTFLISVFEALSLPDTTRWHPMQVCIEGMPGSGDTATE